MLRYVNRHRLGSIHWRLVRLSFIVLQSFFAGQLKASVGGEDIFDPMKGAANGTFGAIVIVGDGLHGYAFAVVFQGDEEFIAYGQSGRSAKCLASSGRRVWSFRC